MIRNSGYWILFIRDSFLPTLDYFRKAIIEKIIPAFNDLEKEAEKISDEEYDRLGSLPSDGDGPDGADLAESAFEKGLEHISI